MMFRTISFIFSFLILISPRLFAHVPDSLIVFEPVSFEHYFSALNLDSNHVETSILSDYGSHPVDFSLFNGESMFSTIGSIEDVYYLLQGVSASMVGNQIPPNTSELINAMSNTLIATSRVPVAIVAYKYDRFCDDAITSGKVIYEAQNELVEYVYNSDNQWINPYTQEFLVAFAPYINVIGRSAIFDFSTIFRYSNLPIQTIKFNPGDGQFHDISGSTYSHYYSSAGTKTLGLKITLVNNINLYARSEILVLDEYDGTVAPAFEHFTSTISSDGVTPTADVDVLFANGTQTGFTKTPVIIAEGFDPFLDPYGLLKSPTSTVANGRGFNDINSFKKYLGTDYLNNIDLVYVNWNNSTASIESNADILRQVIEWVNENNFSNNKNIVIGQSMGGLIARYALCSMENQNNSHNVAVFVSDDTPHLGANVPLGVVYAAQHLFDIVQGYPTFKHRIDNLAKLDLSQYYDELMALRNSSSVRQMLINYVNDDYELDNSLYNSFQLALRNLGFPQGDTNCPIINLAVSNGGVNNYVSSAPLLDISLQGSIEEYSQFILSCLMYLGASTFIAESPLWLSLFTPSHSSLETRVKVLPYLGSNSKVYEHSVTLSTSFLWGGEPLVLAANIQSHYSPSSQIPLDDKNGAFYGGIDLSIIDSLRARVPHWASVYAEESTQDRFMFVPTVSSLCYKNGLFSNPAQVYQIDFASSGVSLNDLPFDGYRFSSDNASEHIDFTNGDLDWILEVSDLRILESIQPDNTHVYSLNNTTYTPVWSTSNPSIATINSNSGELIIHSYGTFFVYATVEDIRSQVCLKKSVTIPAPPLNGFPTYSLSCTDNTLDGVTSQDDFRVRATASSAIDPTISSYVKYCWGRKIGTSSSITWVETTSLTHFFTMGLSESHTAYFRVRYLNDYSPTYSILCRPRPRIVIVDHEGNLYSEDSEEESFIQVKSVDVECVVQCLGEEIYFDHNPALSEICTRMLSFDSFKAKVKQLKPWGDEEIVIVPYTCTNLSDFIKAEDVIVFLSRGSLE